MKTYKVIQPEDHDIKKKLAISYTDVITLLSEISSGADAIILPKDIYNSLIRHPGFSLVYATQCYTCPFSECFLFVGKWWASENAVSPFLLAMSLIKDSTMKLKIERTVGETWESFDMEGDYEEVLALVTELGFCKEVVYNPNVIINTNSQKSSLDILKEYYTKWILNEKHPGGLLAR